MHCLYCSTPKTNVVNSRPGSENTVWRRRNCESCKKTFTTKEATDFSLIKVSKASGAKESFSRYKLSKSLDKALVLSEKYDTIDYLTQTILARVEITNTGHISSLNIRTTCLSVLTNFDKNAALRYESL